MSKEVNLTPETVIPIDGRQLVCVDGLYGHLIPVSRGILVYFSGIEHDISNGTITSRWVVKDE